MSVDHLRNTKEHCCSLLLSLPNVVTVGEGKKIRDGENTGRPCIVVGVTKKVPATMLTETEVIPKAIVFPEDRDGEPVEVDVVEVNLPRALARTDRLRPAPPGCSIGHPAVTAGTFGCLVEDADGVYALSNNHVAANSNNANVGDPIYQPGVADGGGPGDEIGFLYAFVPISFNGGGSPIPPIPPLPPECEIATGTASFVNFFAKLFKRKHRLIARQESPGVNIMDAAAVQVDPSKVLVSVLDIGAPTGVAPSTVGDMVTKSGRTSGVTSAEVLQINVTAQVQYGAGQVAMFEGQVITGPLLEPGDSGSAVLDDQNRVVGLAFAGSDQIGIYSPIIPILDTFEVSLVTAP